MNIGRRICGHRSAHTFRNAPTIPPVLERIILRATERNPEDRYPTAADFAHDLGRFLVEHPPPPPSDWD